MTILPRPYFLLFDNNLQNSVRRRQSRHGSGGEILDICVNISDSGPVTFLLLEWRQFLKGFLLRQR